MLPAPASVVLPLHRTQCFASLPSLTDEEEFVRTGRTSFRSTNLHSRNAENLTDEHYRSNCKSIFNADLMKLKGKTLVVLHISRKVQT
ncbi:hypothetical protein PAXINDRAFT_19188 [Paxillus involutus ATCC 200175]|uniref:Uncharacterized protein n=1 Tax=Paxillus involutus ATCC 200175 TaxID=664439 RepID=A0A0C9T944_PAXIN|nr:hypothetical protein PAXINDRAFT_19188 [Paxillus involutus ATCC 200175]